MDHQPLKESKIGEEQEAPKIYDVVKGCRAMVIEGPMNVLLIAMPFAFLSWALEWPGALTFTLSLLSLAPFAERLGFVTEQLAMHTNDTIGGLLNATFGNATELIVSVAAIKVSSHYPWDGWRRRCFPSC